MPPLPSSPQSMGPVARLPTPQAPEAPDRPGATETLGAAWRQSNIASSVYDRLTTGPRPSEWDEDYSPFDDIQGYEQHADRFIASGSAAETAFIKQRIAQEEADRDVIRRAGGWGIAASLVAGATDPLTLLTMAVPVARETRGARILTNIAQNFAADAVTEAAFHGLQETRTLTDSTINISAGALLGGIVGSLGRNIPSPELEKARRALGEELKSLDDLKAPDSTAGASAVARTTMEQESLAAGGETLATTVGKVSPGLRVMTSRSLEARRIVQELAEITGMTKKNLEGIRSATSVETILKRYQGDWWVAYRERGRLYKQYRDKQRALGGPVLPRKMFDEEVAFAMRRGDDNIIAEVAQAAQFTRKVVLDPLAEKAGVKDSANIMADSYLLRQYNVRRIRANLSEWLEMLVKGYVRKGIDIMDATDIAHKVTRNILGTEQGLLNTRALDDVVPKSGRTAERTIQLTDEELEPWLVSDIDNLTQAYIRTLAPEVEVTARFGDRDLKDAFDKIKAEYVIYKEDLIGNDKAIKALAREEAQVLEDLAAIRDRLYGKFGSPKDPGSFFVRAGRLVRAVNYTRLLGGQVVSALTDVARLMMIHGAPKMMSSALRLSTNIRALNLGREQARRMGIGLDLVLNTRGIALGDISEYATYAEQAVMRKVSDVFSVASLQSPWNALFKSWASVMSQDDVLRAATKVAAGGQLSKRTAARMANLGLDEDHLQRIAAEFKEHGTTGGLRFGNSDQWTDQRLAQAYEAAILKESDTAVLTPGAADLPLVHSTEWGKTLLQFKSFALASVARLQVPIAQGFAQGDIRTMYGFTAMLGLGSAVYTLKQMAADQPITSDPKRFAMEMVDRSGMLGWAGDILYPSLWQMGSDDFSRWSDRNAFETMLGPSAGTVGDIWASRIPAKLLAGDLTEKDVHKLRKLMPGQNLFYLRRGINALEEGAADAIGAQ